MTSEQARKISALDKERNRASGTRGALAHVIEHRDGYLLAGEQEDMMYDMEEEDIDDEVGIEDDEAFKLALERAKAEATKLAERPRSKK